MKIINITKDTAVFSNTIGNKVLSVKSGEVKEIMPTTLNISNLLKALQTSGAIVVLEDEEPYAFIAKLSDKAVLSSSLVEDEDGQIKFDGKTYSIEKKQNDEANLSKVESAIADISNRLKKVESAIANGVTRAEMTNIAKEVASIKASLPKEEASTSKATAKAEAKVEATPKAETK